MNVNLFRGDIWMVDLGSNGIGSEQQGRRPCVIVQNNVGNAHSPTTIVAVVTSAFKTKLPTHFVIGKKEGLAVTSICLCEQVVVIDKSRLQEYIGRLSPEKVEQLDNCLKISLGLNSKFK